MTARIDPTQERQIDELLTARKLTARQIAEKVGVGITIVYAMMQGVRSRDLSRRLVEKSTGDDGGQGMCPEFCKVCRAMVIMPCLACKTRAAVLRRAMRERPRAKVVYEPVGDGSYREKVVPVHEKSLMSDLSSDALKSAWELREAHAMKAREEYERAQSEGTLGGGDDSSYDDEEESEEFDG